MSTPFSGDPELQLLCLTDQVLLYTPFQYFRLAFDQAAHFSGYPHCGTLPRSARKTLPVIYQSGLVMIFGVQVAAKTMATILILDRW